MTRNTKIALLVSAAVLVGATGLAVAHMEQGAPPEGHGPLQGMVHKGRLADRLLGEFDGDKDGKITRAEFNDVLGARFAAAAHGAREMTQDQFAAIHHDDLGARAAEMFQRMDWNGDGKLTLDEFVAPQRARFQMMDHDGTGAVTCRPVMPADFKPGDRPADPHERDGGRDSEGWGHGAGGFAGRGFGGGHGFAGHGRHGGPDGSRGGFGRAAFCHDGDLTRDGKVTRVEFDQIMATQFREASGGQPYLTLKEFTAAQEHRYREMTDKSFKRLDKDDDGKLSMAEFSAGALHMFDRLDRNQDGVIDGDEMMPHGRGGWHGRGHARGHDAEDRSPPPSGDDDKGDTGDK